MANLNEAPSSEPKKINLAVVDIGQLRDITAEGKSALVRDKSPEATGVSSAASAAPARAPKKKLSRLRRAWRQLTTAAFYRPVGALLKRSNIRFVVSAYPNRIGHLASELDLLIKEMELGHREKMRMIYLLPKGVEANAALVDIWAQRVNFIRSRFFINALKPFQQDLDLVHFLTTPFEAETEATPYARVMTEWGDRDPVVTLPEWMKKDAEAALQRWGMPEGGWYVCVHNREPHYSPGDEHVHRYRNANIDNYKLAMEEIVAAGGFVVRMGDPTMKAAPKMDGVYDYANSDERAPHLDIALTANCRFLLGTTSGLYSVAAMFNRPCAQTNAAPAGVAPGVTPRDVCILKLYKDESGRTYRFTEVFAKGASRWRASQMFRNARIRLEQNSPEEIRDLVFEMIERDEGRFAPTEDDIVLQRTFRRFLTPLDYSYGSSGNVGRAFLRKYAMFL